jgi:hypothetical protein
MELEVGQGDLASLRRHRGDGALDHLGGELGAG